MPRDPAPLPETISVRLTGALRDFAASSIGEDGAYPTGEEYLRDLVRRDRERAEREAFERLRAELAHAFAAPDGSFAPLTAAEVIARNRG